MSHFLWVEDFAGPTLRDTTASVFGEFLKNQEIPNTKREVKKLLEEDGVFVELSFLDGLEFIRNSQKLFKVDYIILDIWLDVNVDPDENKLLPAILREHGYKHQPDDEIADENSLNKAKAELLQVAGYRLYVELVMEQGFPKDHILFCSDHAKEQKSIQAKFEQAHIKLPLLLSKDDKANVQNWVRERHENPYFVLRRGIINGCRYILSQLDSHPAAEIIQFHQFIKQGNAEEMVNDMRDYLTILQNFLLIRQPDDKQKRYNYKLFVRTLVHEWEAAVRPLIGQTEEPLQTFGWIMKNVRNWVTHKNVFENLTEKDVAFLFLINMRSMFQLDTAKTLPFEKALLGLFGQPLSQAKMSSLIDDNRLNLAKSYSSLKKKVKNNQEEAVAFVAMLNNLVNRDKVLSQEISRRLLQMFWHGLSWVKGQHVNTSTDRWSRIENRYGKDNPNSFLFQLARHIYSDSKLEE